MAEKRQRPQNGGGYNAAPHAKKFRSNNDYNSNGHRKPVNDAKAKAAYNRRQEQSYSYLVADLPENTENCLPCNLSAIEMETGLIALLDQFVQEECGPKGSPEVRHHARALRELLADRNAANTNVTAQTNLRALDVKVPDTVAPVAVPPYMIRKIELARDLPALPPITEPHLEIAVFTHASWKEEAKAPERHITDDLNYERLEVLGDAYIECIASRLLYSRFPDLTPSHMCYLRELLVKNDTLSKYSEAYSFGERLKHGRHIKESKNWPKVLADVFEAYVAALVLCNPATGYATAEQWLTQLWAPRLLDYKVPMLENPRARDDLNKKVMGKGIKLDYREERDMIIQAGKQKYFIGVYLTGWGFQNEWLGSGTGQNKNEACIAAATDALKDPNGYVRAASLQKLNTYPEKTRNKVLRAISEEKKDKEEPISKSSDFVNQLLEMDKERSVKKSGVTVPVESAMVPVEMAQVGKSEG